MPLRVIDNRQKWMFPNVVSAWLVCALLSSGLVRLAMAQDTTAPAPAPPTKPAAKTSEPATPTGPCVLELDLPALLLNAEVSEQTLVDPVWDVRAVPGHRLMQIPFKVNFPAGRKEPIVITTTSVRVRGSIALCWHIVDEEAPRGKGAESELIAREHLPKNIPTIARKFTLDPENVVKWPLERALFGGTLRQAAAVASENDQYILKLDAKQLNARSPGAPPSPKRNGGEDERVWAERIGKEAAEHKAKTAQFNELAKRIRSLPDEFEAPMPTRLWLIVDINPTFQDIEVTMDPNLENAAPPWRILSTHLAQLRKNTAPIQVASGGERPTLPNEANDLIATLNTMIATPHINNQRIAAIQISLTNLTRYAVPGDTLYKLLESLIKSGDSYIITIMVKELATVFPPTNATGSLLLIAQPFLTSIAKRDILAEKLKNKGDPHMLVDIILDINKLMEDAGGAAPDELIDQLMVAGDSPERINIIARTIQFDSLNAKRLDQAIARIIENAPTDALCARLLDLKLLGSNSANIKLRTLELLSSAESADKRLGEVFNDYILDVAFGPSKSVAAMAGKARIKMTDQILIDSGTHALFRLLTNSDSKLQELAWKSLVHFSIADSQDPNVDLYRVVVDAALAQSPIPPQIVEFLSHQPNPARIVDSIFRVILLGKDPVVGVLACKALRGCRGVWPVDKAINHLSYGDRHGLAVRIYEYLTGEKAPLVVGLLRQRADNLAIAAWFGSELANDRLPKPEAWGAQIVDGEDRLLELVIATDKDLAIAACSALLYSAGSDDKLAATLLARFQGIEEPNPDSIKAEWKIVRQELYAARIQKIAGPIRIRVELLNQGTSAGSPVNAASSKQPSGNPNIFELGTTDFIANNEGIKLANNAITVTVATTQVGIRVEKPSEVKAMNPELLAKVNLDKVIAPALLVPKSDGSWRGLIALPDGKNVELSFIPTAQ